MFERVLISSAEKCLHSAQAIAVPQFGAVIAATTNGSFGSSYGLLSLSDTNTIARVGHLVYLITMFVLTGNQCIRAGDILFLLAIFVAKCSVIMLTRRLFAAQQHRKRFMCEITMGLCAAWWLGSVLAVTIGCNSSGAIHAESAGSCSGLVCCPSPALCSMQLLTAVPGQALDRYRSSRCVARDYHLVPLLSCPCSSPDELAKKVAGICKLHTEITVRLPRRRTLSYRLTKGKHYHLHRAQHQVCVSLQHSV
jgi:hypothetical protein